jgi:hypothetical protein
MNYGSLITLFLIVFVALQFVNSYVICPAIAWILEFAWEVVYFVSETLASYVFFLNHWAYVIQTDTAVQWISGIQVVIMMFTFIPRAMRGDY